MSKDRDIPTYKKVDFAIWEEKKEIVQRMSGFFRILIQADLRQKKDEHQKEIVELEKAARFYDVEI